MGTVCAARPRGGRRRDQGFRRRPRL